MNAYLIFVLLLSLSIEGRKHIRAYFEKSWHEVNDNARLNCAVEGFRRSTRIIFFHVRCSPIQYRHLNKYFRNRRYNCRYVDDAMVTKNSNRTYIRSSDNYMKSHIRFVYKNVLLSTIPEMSVEYMSVRLYPDTFGCKTADGKYISHANIGFSTKQEARMVLTNMNTREIIYPSYSGRQCEIYDGLDPNAKFSLKCTVLGNPIPSINAYDSFQYIQGSHSLVYHKEIKKWRAEVKFDITKREYNQLECIFDYKTYAKPGNTGGLMCIILNFRGDPNRNYNFEFQNRKKINKYAEADFIDAPSTTRELSPREILIVVVAACVALFLFYMFCCVKKSKKNSRLSKSFTDLTRK